MTVIVCTEPIGDKINCYFIIIHTYLESEKEKKGVGGAIVKKKNIKETEKKQLDKES